MTGAPLPTVVSHACGALTLRAYHSFDHSGSLGVIDTFASPSSSTLATSGLASSLWRSAVGAWLLLTTTRVPSSSTRPTSVEPNRANSALAAPSSTPALSLTISAPSARPAPRSLWSTLACGEAAATGASCDTNIAAKVAAPTANSRARLTVTFAPYPPDRASGEVCRFFLGDCSSSRARIVARTHRPANDPRVPHGATPSSCWWRRRRSAYDRRQ